MSLEDYFNYFIIYSCRPTINSMGKCVLLFELLRFKAVFIAADFRKHSSPPSHIIINFPTIALLKSVIVNLQTLMEYLISYLRRCTMHIQKAIELFRTHKQMTNKCRTMASYKKLLERLEDRFSEHHVESISSEEVCQFLVDLTKNSAKATRHLRYAQLKAFFNFIIES